MRKLALIALVLGLTAGLGVTVMAQDKEVAKEDSKMVTSFKIKDTDGKMHDSKDYADKIVVLEWFCPSCPAVKPKYMSKSMQKLQEKYAGKGVVWLAVSSNHYEKTDNLNTFKKENGVKVPVLYDNDGQLGRQFGAKTTPHMFVLNKGELVYQGAIDDRAETNYVAAAIDELMEGKKVTTSKTRPYG